MPIPGAVAAKLTAKRRLPAPPMRKAIRLGAGMTQADVAETLDVRRESVARWESGARDPRGETLIAYVDLLDELREAQT
jgi:DNA-binding transcriptional regulator YiaG